MHQTAQIRELNLCGSVLSAVEMGGARGSSWRGTITKV